MDFGGKDWSKKKQNLRIQVERNKKKEHDENERWQKFNWIYSNKCQTKYCIDNINAYGFLALSVLESIWEVV